LWVHVRPLGLRPRARTAAAAESARTHAESSKAVADVERRDVRMGERHRRRAIEVLYQQLGSADEEHWDGQGGTAADIAGRLMLDSQLIDHIIAEMDKAFADVVKVLCPAQVYYDT